MVRGVGEGAIILKISVWGRRGGDFSREAINRGTVIIRKVTFFLLKATKFVVCSSKNIDTPPPHPHGGHFCFRVPTCTTRGCLTFPLPQPLEFPKFSNLVGYPLEKYFRQKCHCKILYAKDNCFCDKDGKNIFIYVNTLSNDLNFAL